MRIIHRHAAWRAGRGLPALVLALALGACTVGPDFQRPPAPAGRGYAPAAMPSSTASAPGPGGDAQHFARAMDVPGQWWTLFHSAPLNALVDDALKHNPDVSAAQQALQAALENARAQEGAFFPQLGASVDPTRQETGSVLASSVVSNASLYSLTTAQLSIAYAPDLWGANRRQVESLVAQADAQRFQLEATYLTLTTNLVNAAVGEASLRAQIAATRDMVASQAKILEAVRRQRALGALADSDVAAQEAALAQTRAALPPLQKELAQQRDLLAALSGRPPDQAWPVRFELAALQLPRELPVSLPARLVEQRPDVRMAEATLHAACAQVGVAFAARLPNIDITASGGSAAEQMHGLFGHGTGFWNLGAAIAAPIFDGGALRHRQRAAEANYREAAEQYRSTVMSALQNVADALHAVQSDAQTLAATERAEQAAARSLAIARRRLALGDLSEVGMLDAEIAYRQAGLATIQARASRYADTVALFQAMGGGWWNRRDVAIAGTPATDAEVRRR
jgi:NodT family efflux transporter outer membrane factor (OMF) lipoprotein